MTQYLVDSRNKHADIDMLEKAYRFRHRFFVEHMKWEALRKADGREIDQFDTDSAVHVIGLDDQGSVYSYSRLLPTMEPHLLSDVYPELLQGADEPIGPTIWEWTRASVDPNRREGSRGADMATIQMSLGAVEACLKLGITHLSVQTHPMLLSRLIELGWKCEPLALPMKIEGSQVVPFLAGVDESTLEQSRRVLGYDKSVLIVSGIEEQSPNPPLQAERDART